MQLIKLNGIEGLYKLTYTYTYEDRSSDREAVGNANEECTMWNKYEEKMSREMTNVNLLTVRQERCRISR